MPDTNIDRRSLIAGAVIGVGAAGAIDHGPFRHQPVLNIIPKRHDDFSCQRRDRDAADTALAIGDAPSEPLTERAVRLMPEP